MSWRVVHAVRHEVVHEVGHFRLGSNLRLARVFRAGKGGVGHEVRHFVGAILGVICDARGKALGLGNAPPKVLAFGSRGLFVGSCSIVDERGICQPGFHAKAQRGPQRRKALGLGRSYFA